MQRRRNSFNGFAAKPSAAAATTDDDMAAAAASNVSNVNVYCRVRPESAKELASGDSAAAYMHVTPDSITINLPTPAKVAAAAEERRRSVGNKKNSVSSSSSGSDSDDEKSVPVRTGTRSLFHHFGFDGVFNSEASQHDVFEGIGGPALVDRVLAGINQTVLAYGQTGSGKTHTQLGQDGDDGLVPRIIKGIFGRIAQSDSGRQFTIQLSNVEIFNEQCNDLLNLTKRNLTIRETAAKIWMQDLTTIYCHSVDDCLAAIRTGAENRAVGSTCMNTESSRSHSIVVVDVTQSCTEGILRSQLVLVDLAGSEKINKARTKGSQLKEACYINRSLSTLGNCVNALAERRPHVPFRDSKLTRYLTKSLGGNAGLSLIVCCSPSARSLDETISTMAFAKRAKCVKNEAKVNIEPTIEQLHKELARARDQIGGLQVAVSQGRLEAEKARAAAAKATAAAAAASCDSDPEKAHGSEQERARLEHEVDRLELDLSAVNARLAALTQENDRLHDAMLELRGAHETECGRSAQLEGQLDALKAAGAAAQAQLEELQAASDSAAFALKGGELREKEWKIRERTLRDTIDGLNTRIEVMEADEFGAIEAAIAAADLAMVSEANASAALCVDSDIDDNESSKESTTASEEHDELIQLRKDNEKLLQDLLAKCEETVHLKMVIEDLEEGLDRSAAAAATLAVSKSTSPAQVAPSPPPKPATFQAVQRLELKHKEQMNELLLCNKASDALLRARQEHIDDMEVRFEDMKAAHAEKLARLQGQLDESDSVVSKLRRRWCKDDAAAAVAAASTRIMAPVGQLGRRQQ